MFVNNNTILACHYHQQFFDEPTFIARSYDQQNELYLVQGETDYFVPEVSLSDRICQYVKFVFEVFRTCDFRLTDVDLRALAYSLWHGKKTYIFCTDMTPPELPLNESLTGERFRRINLDHKIRTSLPEADACLPLRFSPYILQKADQFTEISLDNCSTVATEIGYFRNVTSLTLVNGTLNDLPYSISNLTNLTRVDLRYNKLGGVPEHLITFTQSHPACKILVRGNQDQFGATSVQSGTVHHREPPSND